MERLLIVDNSEADSSSLKRLLGDLYQIEVLNSGSNTINYIQNHQPDAALIAIGLPDMTGFDVTRRLVETDALQHTAVILVTSEVDTQTQIDAMTAGGDDLVQKPISRDTLDSKIRFLLKQKHEQRRLQGDLKKAHNVAMTAMSNVSELGQAMRFVESSFSMFDVQELAQEFCNTLSGFGLRSLISIHPQTDPYFYACTKIVKPVEKHAMVLLQEKGRFYDFGSRTQVNYPNVSVLIKNMPIGDEEKYGRYKDLLPSMIGCLDARISDLGVQDDTFAQAKELSQSLDNIQTTIDALTKSICGNQKQASDRLHTMVSEIEIFVQMLGLEQDQEERVIKYIDEAVEDSLSLLDSADTVIDAIDSIMQKLKHTIAKQNNMVDRISYYRQAQSESVSEDIDLF